jgi:UDP-glucose 4-epimerase
VTRDYIYVSDVADAFARAVEYDGAKSVFNISSGVGTSLNELIIMIEHVLGRDVARRYRPGRLFDVPVNILENSLAQQELGWAPRVGLEEGIVKTADWMRKVLDK